MFIIHNNVKLVYIRKLQSFNYFSCLFQGIFLFQVIKFSPLRYNVTYEYPSWAQAIGMCLAFVSMVCVPLGFVWTLTSAPGNLRQVGTSIIFKANVTSSISPPFLFILKAFLVVSLHVPLCQRVRIISNRFVIT